MTQPLIMLTGKLKSGKSTLANDLLTIFDMKRDSFARPLKAGLKEMGIVTEGPNKDREALQYFGADYFRRRDPDWWVKLLAANNKDMHQTGLIIDDCRFPNELAWGADNGFLLVRIKVSPETQVSRGANYAQLDHSSETALDGLSDSFFDVVLEENTSVYERVIAVIDAIASKF